ncbi:MAG: FAD/NAD(P)-binding oxidoreductase [Planctomycetota bacterium]
MTDRRQTQVAIVGAGPAGVAAAVAIAAAGGRVTLVDEAHRPGGQIYRQPPRGFAVRESKILESPNHARGHELLTQLAELEVDVLTESVVWDATPGVLWLERAGRPMRLDWQHLVVATGAHDRAVPFPGWTLPGVITAGGAQVLVRGALVTPGTRAVVAGTGPLLLPTITALLAAGVEIVAALEACSRSRALRVLPAVLRSPTRRREAAFYARQLLGRRVSLMTGSAVFAAHGDQRVQRVVYGRVDRQGRPRRETAREVAADVLCVGFGLQPQIEVAGRLGCDLHHVEARGGWIPRHDAAMRTSRDGVWVAGEAAGIGGVDCALAEGRLAGLGIAAALGLPDAGRDAAMTQARREQQRERRAADAMLRAFTVPPGLAELAADDTVVCRCEDVTLAQLRAGVAVHGAELRAAKMATRAGMGPCQGRVCGALVEDLLRHRLGAPAAPLRAPVVQAPIKPVALETMAFRASSADGA